ncbi:VOC family protein [Diaminobutyricibacter sp. McL0608]|uniref:VOC family protein n=1 Tax=Leifsonia sp. McL0608 TaxID=3143537 RepID=UPI0031F31C98
MATLANIVFYANDPQALSDFWAGVFRYPPQRFDGELREELLAGGLTEADLGKRALAASADGTGPRLFFHHADGPKTGRNRVHLDVQAVQGRRPTDDELDAERDRLVALGASVARLIDQAWGPVTEHYYQMRDPEGNEFCLQ